MNQPASGSLGGTKLVIIALCVALVAVVANYAYINRVQEKANESTFPVFLLTRTVNAGEKFQTKDVRQLDVPERFLPAMTAMGIIREQEENNLAAQDTTYGRSAKVNALLTNDLFVRERGGPLTPEQGRAWMTLPISPRSSPPMLDHDMRVDIAAPFSTGGARPDMLVVMENVKVVQVGNYLPSSDSTSRARSGNYDNITIDVSPAQALDLAGVRLAAAGPFDLWIRNASDNRAVSFGGGINPRVLDLVQGRGRGGLRLNPGAGAGPTPGIFGNN